MASWAAITKADAPKPTAEPSTGDAVAEPLSYAVVDANAIINGLNLAAIGATGTTAVVTIQEVLDEIRDKRSRQNLATLPFTIQVKEPSEESVKTVTQFARETGDIHALSVADIKLLALAHTLEVAAHGTAHLREHPPQLKVKSKTKTRARNLPGWGYVPNPEDWKVVDEMADEDDDASASGAGFQSRIVQHIQSLSLAKDETAGATGAEAGSSAAAATTAPVAQPQPSAQAANDGGAADDDDGWATAATSRNAARRQQRKQVYRAYRQDMDEQKWGVGKYANAPAPSTSADASSAAPATASASGAARAGAAAAAGEPAASGSGAAGDAAPSRSASEGEESGDETGDSDSEDGSEEGEESGSQDSESGSEEHSDDDEDDDASDADTDALSMPAIDSSVMIYTADFPMQNVLLQMGLRLVAKDGRRISRLSRYVLRCSGCFAVSREMERIFCPRCGNMTLERVEVTVGPDGAELFGVRRKHILRGTKYSLPKPRPGRNANNPVLCEDMMKKKRPRNKPAPAAGAEGATLEELSSDTWHKGVPSHLGNKGVAAALASWKHNPNEVKGKRTNRRK